MLRNVLLRTTNHCYRQQQQQRVQYYVYTQYVPTNRFLNPPQQQRLNTTVDDSIRIGDVTIATPPRGTGRPDLIPNTNTTILPPSSLLQLKWMLQKDLQLQQDFCLVSNNTQSARKLILEYASLCGREVEYVVLDANTSDFNQ